LYKYVYTNEEQPVRLIQDRYMNRIITVLFLVCVCCVHGMSQSFSDTAYLVKAIKKLAPLHKPISDPGPFDWLAQHDEPGQTFRQYYNSSPVMPRGKRRIIYIQPVGSFADTQRTIIMLTADFMSSFFNLQVKVLDSVPLSVIPAHAKRKHPNWGMDQILSTYILTDILKPRLPTDAAAYLAFTTSDLWPGEGWNFVFGQASLRNRTGVWSIYRNGEPAENFNLCLLRTLKIAVHETAHMFSMYHCTLYECCMCGSNHQEESDRRPLYLCPECMAKICYAAKTDPVKRYTALAEFCEEYGFEEEKGFYEMSIARLKLDKDL